MDGKTIVDMWLEHRFSDPGKYLTFEHLAAAIDAALTQAKREGQEAMRERAAGHVAGSEYPIQPPGTRARLAAELANLPVE